MNDKNETSPSRLTYREAGVDIDAGNELVERIKPAVKKTSRPGLLGGIGGFGGLFELPWQDYSAPVLVTGTDGVGTKLRLAISEQRYDGIGIDLVAMCVNDIIVTGAEPLMFLDYYATSQLDINIAAEVIEGIADGCQQAGAALAGGETAEMPGMYHAGDFDVAGFAVGIVEKQAIIDGNHIEGGDVILGLASSGPHSNGFSLINRVLDQVKEQLTSDKELQALQSTITSLLEPTRIYVKPVLKVINEHPIKALAHITGGGLLENLPRVLPLGHDAIVDTNTWPRQEVFKWLKKHGNIDTNEMYRVFNCGIGMAVVVAAADTEAVLTAFQSAGETGYKIGHISRGSSEQAPASVHLHNSDVF